MTDWMGYEAIVTARGRTRRDRIINQARDHLERTAPDQPSYTKCLVDGHEVNMLIMGGDTADQKKFRVMPTDNHYVTYGNIVEWSNSHWIVIHADFDDSISKRGYMQYCNHKFKFQAHDGRVYERWGVLDSGVYSTTVKNTLAMPELNTQYKVYLPYDDDTKYLYIDQRFAGGMMYDRTGDPELAVYKFTKYDPLTQNQGNGRLLVMHCAADVYDPARDDIELGICDYVKPGDAPAHTTLSIVPVASPNPVIGGAPSAYQCVLTSQGDLPDDLTWTWQSTDMSCATFTLSSNDKALLSVSRFCSVGTLFVLRVSSALLNTEASITVEAVSIY